MILAMPGAVYARTVETAPSQSQRMMPQEAQVEIVVGKSNYDIEQERLAAEAAKKTITARTTTARGDSPCGDDGIARNKILIADYTARTFGADQVQAMMNIVQNESGFCQLIWNRSGSGAYGLGQALPASKMGVYGADYMTNSETQVRWLMAYCSARYVTPQRAWAHWQAVRSW